jgi:hypothetical protein
VLDQRLSREMSGNFFNVRVGDIEGSQRIVEGEKIFGIGAAWTMTPANPVGNEGFVEGPKKMRIALASDVNEGFGEGFAIGRIEYW